MSYRSKIIHILAGITLSLASPALAQDLEEVILGSEQEQCKIVR